jgi:lipid II:glycine glycyltransferase (peptidoglycan interpeptide bridge formation enzyme)
MLAGDDDRVVDAFPSLSEALFQSEGIVAEFAHLHPWRGAREVLDPNFCLQNREIVWIDLTLSIEQLWHDQFQHSCRKNIARAVREGVNVLTDSSDGHIREFVKIYHGTMQVRQALPRYHFPYEYFCALRDELPQNARFVFAECRDQIVASTLYLYDDDDVYSFLGGADAAFQQVRPTNAVIWDTIQWARAAGRKRLILGGGYKPDDGVFRFKATFSRLRRAFHIYRRVHLEHDYAQLERRCREYYRVTELPSGYFPSYRQTPQLP